MPYVLDASAAIALLLDEPGAERVAEVLPQSFMSAVNLSEAINVFARHGLDIAAAHAALAALELEIAPFDADLALAAALLQPATGAAGLSLGDRACLALAAKLEAIAMTSDRAWLKVADAVGVEIVLIR